MPLQKLQFKPGTNRESTNYANEGGWFTSEKVRFRSGQPEKVGGWVKDTGSLSPEVAGVTTTITSPPTTFVATASISGTALLITSLTSGAVAVGQVLTGTGVTTGTTIVSGGGAVWVVSPSQTVTPNTITGTGSTGTIWGTVRSMWNWFNLASYNLLALGSNLKYYIQNSVGGNYFDVSPIRKTSAIVATAFTTTNGSTVVVVNDPGHGAQTNDFVTITATSGAVNGIPAATMGTTLAPVEYQITYLTTNTYSIIVATAATSTGTSAVTATFNYQIATGNEVFTYGTGWGASGYGGTTGSSANTTTTVVLNGTYLRQDLTTATTGAVSVGSEIATFAASGTVYIEQEQITYSARTTTAPYTMTISARAAGGTTAATHTSGMPIAEFNTTTITVTSTTNFTATGTIFIGSEAITYTGVGATTFTGCVRGTGSTTPAGHAVSSGVYQYPASGVLIATGWGSPATSGIGTQLRLWSQSNFGENLVLNARGGALYYWVVNANPAIINRAQVLASTNTNTQSTTGGTTAAWWQADAYCPSVCNFVMVSDASRFVIAFGVNDYGATQQDPMLVRWSDQESVLTWYPAVTNQAGSYRLSHGSTIIAAIQTRQEILVFTDQAVYSMQYLGPPYVWGFQILGDNISIAGPNAIATANNITYWMGTDKFYMYSGRVQTLPSTLREYVFNDINLEQSFQICSGTNEGYNEVWWHYCSAGSTVVNRYVIYNHLDNVWYYGTWTNYAGNTQGRTAWLDSALRAYPMAATYGTANGTTNGLLLYHENGVDDGTVNPPVPIVSSIGSSDFDIGDGHNFGFVWRLIPDLSFDGSTVNQPYANFTVLPRTFPGAAYGPSNDPAVISTQNYQEQRTYNIQYFTQQVYVRMRGRQMSFQVSSGTTGSVTDGLGVQWQLGVPRIDIRPDGRR